MDGSDSARQSRSGIERAIRTASQEVNTGVRPCRRVELVAVLALWRETRGVPGKTDDQQALERLLDRDEDALLVGVRDGRIVGSVIAAWDGWRGNMYRLTVHPSHQREGIALRLIEAGEAVLRNRGARRVTALVWEQDPRAVAVWRRAEYQHDAGTGRFVKNLGD
jgi:ribosomal protein S18 acetylase RimI-like enzyme